MVLLLLPILTSALLPAVSSQPNIVLIVADDLGWADVPWHDPSIYAPRWEKCQTLELDLKLTNTWQAVGAGQHRPGAEPELCPAGVHTQPGRPAHRQVLTHPHSHQHILTPSTQPGHMLLQPSHKIYPQVPLPPGPTAPGLEAPEVGWSTHRLPHAACPAEGGRLRHPHGGKMAPRLLCLGIYTHQEGL